MKIVIKVDYSSLEFNKDFKLSNMLLSKGHNVFLAVGMEQFLYLKKNCDKAVLGYSIKDKSEDVISIANMQNFDSVIELIEK